MLVRFRQPLKLGGRQYQRGEVADLPQALALACFGRGTAEQPGPGEQRQARRAQGAEQNRARYPEQNRARKRRA